MSGRVAQVLNERELAINIGRADGVRVGMRFAVLAERPIKIHDPETGSVLGTYDMPKVLVEAKDVNDHFSVCRTYRFSTIGGMFDAGFRAIVGPARRIYETVEATEQSFPTPLSQEDSYVKIGDRVERVAAEEEQE